jgi:CRISPR-associated endonuclease/helicase Cas3
MRDQERSLRQRLTSWMPKPWAAQGLNYTVVDAQKLDQYQEINEIKRSDALAELFNADAVLTNPDIFHLVMQFGYRDWGAGQDLILSAVARRYDLFVFDEFHLFGAAQTASVLIALLLLRQMKTADKPPRFLFLSATANEQMDRLAAKVGLQTAHIGSPEDYRHGQPQPSDDADWRRILQEVVLHIHTAKIEDWVDQQIDSIILPFFQEQPVAKGLVICNSVAAAHRVYEKVKPRLQQALQKKVGLNTGLTPIKDRATSEEADLIVATSTVDVGVDFSINFLVFESLDSASHIQRLGRLGRHAHDQAGRPFQHFEAHALLPAWVAESLSARFAEDSAISRHDYRCAITEAFPAQQTFENYIRKWAGVQAAHVMEQLKKPHIKTQYAAIHQELNSQFSEIFPKYIGRYRFLSQEQQRYTLEAARAFRSSSVFTALVKNSHAASQEIVDYNLLSLLRQAEVEWVELEKMVQEGERHGQSREALLRGNPLAAYRLRGWLSNYRPICIKIETELSSEQFERVQEMQGFRFDVPGLPELKALNDALEERILPVFLIPNEAPDNIRRKCRLGMQIELLPFRQSSTGRTGTVAFGRDALLLDSVWHRQRQGSDDSPMIV